MEEKKPTEVYYIDFHDVASREDLFRIFRQTIPIPDADFRNLDALHDLLGEYGGNWDIIIYNTGKAREKLGTYYDRFVRMCEDSVGEGSGLRIRIYP